MKYILIILVAWITQFTARHFLNKLCSCHWKGNRGHNWSTDHIRFAGNIEVCTKCGIVRSKQ